MSDEDFLDIISSNGMENLESESEMFSISMQDLIRAMRSLNQCSMLMADFIDSYLSDEDDEEEDDDDTGPTMPVDAVMHAKALIENAEAFIYAILTEGEDDDNDDE